MNTNCVVYITYTERIFLNRGLHIFRIPTGLNYLQPHQCTRGHWCQNTHFNSAQTTQMHLLDSRNPQRRTFKLSKYKTKYHDNSDSNQPNTIGDRSNRRKFLDLEAITSGTSLAGARPSPKSATTTPPSVTASQANSLLR
jgi:hypothetical protein